MKKLPVCFFLFLLSFAVSYAQPATKPAAKNPLDKGDFKVGFPKSDPGKKPMSAVDLKDLADIAAFYDGNGPQIKICYELLDQYEEEFKTISKDPKEIDNMVQDTLAQTLFHELGHCLIDQWELPATGREEDAVDQLATVLLLDGSAEGQDSAINAALEFDIASRNEAKDDMVFWDEHSFSETRFFDMICLVYGSNPKKNAGMIGDDKLPKDRAVRCPGEWDRANRAWMKLLAPYVL
jgi:hypothetical protein